MVPPQVRVAETFSRSAPRRSAEAMWFSWRSTPEGIRRESISSKGATPVTVEGSGLLVYPHQVVAFQSPAAGQIISLAIKVGDTIEKHQVIGRINQPELQQRLEQERVRLDELERRYQQLNAKGESVSLPRLLRDIEERDERDRTRAISPLVPATDAIVIDSTATPIEAVFARVLTEVRKITL